MTGNGEISPFLFRNYSTASVDDFWEAIAEETSGLPAEIILSEAMAPWTAQHGYPIIDVKRNYEEGSAAIRQVPLFETRW